MSSDWFRPRTVPHPSQLISALEGLRALHPVAAPGPPTPEAIMALVRTYGEVLTDAATARCLGEDLAVRRAEHRAAGLYELIEHNVELLNGWIIGYRLILTDLQKGTN